MGRGYSSLTVQDLIESVERRERDVRYESEPIVIGVRSYIAENPAGGRLTYDAFHTVCVKASGIPPYADNREACFKIPKLKAELMRRDGILVETGVHVRHNKGISIISYEPPTAFQVGLEGTEATENTMIWCELSVGDTAEDGKRMICLLDWKRGCKLVLAAPF